MKLSAYSIIILGLAIAAVVLSYGWFQHWVPNTTEAGYWRDQAAAYDTEIAKTNKAKERFEEAVKLRDAKAAAWQRFVQLNTPSTSVAAGGIDLSVNPWQLAIDARKFRNSAQKALNAQLRSGGVTVLEGPEIPTPEPNSTTLLASYFNFGQFAYPIVIWELGAVRVRGTYKQITAHVRAWSRMRGYLAVVDGLAIQGTSPRLDATYNLVLVGYIKGQNFFGGVNEGVAQPASSGTGGSRGGATGGTGVPGMPPGARGPGGAPTPGGGGPGSPGSAAADMGTPGGGKPMAIPQARGS